MSDGEESVPERDDETAGTRPPATARTDGADERTDASATDVSAATGEATVEADLERLRASLPSSARDRLGGEGSDAETLVAIRSALVEWYEADHRAFPWRETTDPYEILVSEVMSQQTQLSRVVDAWAAFLDEWPTVAALAGADRSEVVGFWSDHSLGYNNRAKYLHEAAGQVVDEYDGSFPESPDELQELMGVGPYTANAVASFAFDNGDAVVDTNVKRVLYRAVAVPDDDDAFERVASALMPPGESRVWNNAIMELGGVACQKQPLCDEASCPWREWCHAYQTGDFTAPDLPTQPSFEGSRRQFRGRIVRLLGEHDEMELDTLGHRIRVDYTPDGEHGREWLRGLLSDLSDDGLVQIEDGDGQVTARLQ
jgi:A/G-specific adenine glycosylase